MDIFLGEFLGTSLLILLGNGCTSNVLLHKSKGFQSGWIVISAGWGFAVAMAVYCGGWLSGAHFNPAVTLGFALIGKTAWAHLPLYWFSQMLGGAAGAFVVWIFYYSHWGLTPDPAMKLMCFCTKPAVRQNRVNFAVEVIATSVLLFGILVIFDRHNGVDSALGPYLVGILIFSIGLSLGGPTGFAINPARDLSPRLMHALLPIEGKGSSEWDYAWIPVVAPLLGGCLGSLLYKYFIAT